jgi:hypothetical protein
MKQKPKTIENLDMFIKVTILGLKCNPDIQKYVPKLPDKLEKLYFKMFGGKC